MRKRLHTLVLQQGRCETGFTMVELMIAVFITVGGLMALIGTFDVSRQLNNLSERKEAATHVAEQAMEDVLAKSYPDIGLTSAPLHQSVPSDPRFYVTDGSGANPSTYKWSQGPNALAPTTDPLVVDSGAAVDPNPTNWTDPKSGVSGKVYRFVTWVDDDKCGPDPITLCPGSQDYKRVTIAVTVDGHGAPKKPILISSIASDPRAGPASGVVNGEQNPLADPLTQCRDASNALVTCAASIQGVGKTWFLYDTDATASSVRQEITGDHATHRTIAPLDLTCATLGQGCPKPDLLGIDPPPAPDTLPSLFNYSTDVAGTYTGGRVLKRDTTCAGTPSTSDNTKGAFWTTPTLSSTTTYTGEGGLTVYTQTINGVAAHAKLCLAFYDVPGSILNLVSAPPTLIGRVSYDPATWPTTPTGASFPFNFHGTIPSGLRDANGNVSLVSGHRIGVRAWVDSGSAADIALIYDHPSYPSSVQLNTAGS